MKINQLILLKKCNNTVFFWSLLVLLSLPQFVQAQLGQNCNQSTLNFPACAQQQQPPPTTPTDFASLVALVIGVINLLIPALFGLVFLFFVWKLIDSWVINAGDEQKVADGKQYLLWAILMFVLMITTWGIVTLLRTSFF